MFCYVRVKKMTVFFQIDIISNVSLIKLCNTNRGESSHQQDIIQILPYYNGTETNC